MTDAEGDTYMVAPDVSDQCHAIKVKRWDESQTHADLAAVFVNFQPDVAAYRTSSTPSIPLITFIAFLVRACSLNIPL